MKGSLQNFNNRPKRDRVLDLYYLDRILIYREANKDDDFIIKDLNLSKEAFESYKKRLKKEGQWY